MVEVYLLALSALSAYVVRSGLFVSGVPQLYFFRPFPEDRFGS